MRYSFSIREQGWVSEQRLAFNHFLGCSAGWSPLFTQGYNTMVQDVEYVNWFETFHSDVGLHCRLHNTYRPTYHIRESSARESPMSVFIADFDPRSLLQMLPNMHVSSCTREKRVIEAVKHLKWDIRAWKYLIRLSNYQTLCLRASSKACAASIGNNLGL